MHRLFIKKQLNRECLVCLGTGKGMVAGGDGYLTVTLFIVSDFMRNALHLRNPPKPVATLSQMKNMKHVGLHYILSLADR